MFFRFTEWKLNIFKKNCLQSILCITDENYTNKEITIWLDDQSDDYILIDKCEMRIISSCAYRSLVAMEVVLLVLYIVMALNPQQCHRRHADDSPFDSCGILAFLENSLSIFDWSLIACISSLAYNFSQNFVISCNLCYFRIRCLVKSH